MGTVDRARRQDLPQSLALKVLRPESGRVAERFAREQEILAKLDHPSIVRFLDAGFSPEGDAYYVMELVDGQPIDAYCDRRELGVRARIELFLEVCAAVSHAHQHFVVHRDLKPANVLVDREGRPRLLDFGISKWLDGGENGQETTRGASPMTLQYASPEQVRGVPVAVATDVYSLAVILFELLAGSRPQPPDLDILALAVAIDRQPAPRASQLARERGFVARAEELRGDLDAILAKGLAKEVGERYPSVAALASDLRRYLAGQPVAARGAGAARRALYFVRRHRPALAGATLLVLLLAGAALVFARQARALALEKAKAEQARSLAEARVDLLRQVIAEAGPMGTGPLATLGDGLAAAGFEVERKLAAGEAAGGAMAATAAEAYWRYGDRPRAAALAQASLASPAPLPPRELGKLLALAAFYPAAAPGEDGWERSAPLRAASAAALERSGLSSCELVAPFGAALAELGAPPLTRSLATELAFDCAIENGEPAAARQALAQLEEERGSLPADHPARREAGLLAARLTELESPRPEVLP